MVIGHKYWGIVKIKDRYYTPCGYGNVLCDRGLFYTPDNAYEYYDEDFDQLYIEIRVR